MARGDGANRDGVSGKLSCSCRRVEPMRTEDVGVVRRRLWRIARTDGRAQSGAFGAPREIERKVSFFRADISRCCYDLILMVPFSSHV